jgi:CRP-like cAMP-binding protein
MSVASRWLQRLAQFAHLGPEEQRALEAAAAASRQTFTEDLQKVGDPADRIYAVLDGVVCQYKLLADGRRQILGYLFPGDMCDPRQLLVPHADHSLGALARADVAALGAATMQRLTRYPNISQAFERYALMRQATAREWLVNVGYRTAFERLSHLICEMFTVLSTVGLTRDHSFELPLTQADLGDTLALSTVHVNRTLMELRRLKIVTFTNRQITIHDFAALRAAAGFDPGYLGASPQAAPASSRVAEPARRGL